MTSEPTPSLRRRIAARWDRLALERAQVVVGRGQRGTDPASERAAGEMLRVATRSLPATSSLNDDQRAALASAARSWLAAVSSGDIEPSDADVSAISHGFASLYQPTFHHEPEPPAVVRSTIEDQFHRLYYHRKPHTWERTWYRGHRIVKYPCDLWIYQNIIEELKPGLIIETGTRFGGSAFWLGDQLNYHQHGRVVSIDIEEKAKRPEHERVDYIVGSSSAPEVGDQVRSMLPTDGSPVVAILDSDHSYAHVLDELRLYAPMIPSGSYLIVEDTNVNGRPVYPEFGPGPGEAVDDFLKENSDFTVDLSREVFYMSMHPGGFLKRR